MRAPAVVTLARMRAPPPPGPAPPDAGTSHHLLLGATLTLLVLGQVMVLSASSVDSIVQHGSPYALAAGQVRYAAAGLVVLLVAARAPLRLYRRLGGPLLLGALVLQLLVFTPLGVGEGTRRSWVALGPVVGQPAEVLKVGLALWLGAVLADRQRGIADWRTAALPALPGAALAVCLTLVGHDVGTSLVMATLVAGALFVAGAPLRLFAVAGGAAAVGFVGSRSPPRAGCSGSATGSAATATPSAAATRPPRASGRWRPAAGWGSAWGSPGRSGPTCRRRTTTSSSP